MKWIDCKQRLPEPGREVLVWVDGHRGPAWRNCYALVAYYSSSGKCWYEERHDKNDLIGVVLWAEIDEASAIRSMPK